MDRSEVRLQIIAICKERKLITYEDLISLTGFNRDQIYSICDTLRKENLIEDIDNLGIKATKSLLELSNCTFSHNNQENTPQSDPIQKGNTPPHPDPTSRKKSFKIFLSYGHDEYARDAERIKSNLEKRGHEVWFDLDRIKLGGDWERYIEDGLKNCDKVILLMTPYSVRREKRGDTRVPAGYCLNEIAKAHERNLCIIPILLVDLEDELPPSIKNIPTLDFRPTIPIRDHEDIFPYHFAKLVEFLREENIVKKSSESEEPVAPQLERRSKRSSEKKLKIFLSYGNDEYTENATRIKVDLERRGHNVVFDPEFAVGKIGWDEYVEEEIRECDRVILLMTPQSVSRKNRRDPNSQEGYCLTQIAKALENNKQIIPILLVELYDGIPTSICRIQYLDLRDVVPFNKYANTYLIRFNRLVEAIEEDKLDFEGGQTKLIRYLKPINFQADIGAHLSRFIGRKWIFDEIDDWLAKKPGSRVFWLMGGPGIGKSAVAAYLCHHHGDVIAYHLCIFGHTDKSDPRRALLSIAYQIAQHLPEYDEMIQKLDLEQEVLKNTLTLFDILLVQPFSSGVLKPDGDRLVIIDAIDEATKNGKNEITDFISNQWEKAPSWLKLIITSRPEAAVTGALKSLKPFEFKANRAENMADLQEFLIQELVKKRGIQVPDVTIAKILDLSEGIILYLIEVIKEIDTGRLSVDRIEEFPKGIGDVYKRYFDRQFPDIREYTRRVRPLLECLASQREAIPQEILIKALKLHDLDLQQLLDQTGSLFPRKIISGTRVVVPFHKSIVDWLTLQDEEGNYPSGKYSVDPMKGRERIAIFCLSETKVNAPFSGYALRHLPAELSAASQWKGLSELLKNPRFIKEKIASEGMYALLGDYDIIKFFNLDPDEKKDLYLIQSALRLSSHVLSKDPTQFATQMFGRLIGFEEPGIKNFLISVKKEQNGPWIMPLRQAFEAPGEALIRTMEGHTDGVISIDISSDGKLLVSGSKDKTIRIWNLLTGTCLHILNGHTEGVYSVSFSDDGKMIISGSGDNTIRIWGIDKGNCLHILKGHSKSVYSVTINKTGSLVVSGSDDNTIKIWDLNTRTCIQTLKGHTDSVMSVAMSHDNKYIISGSADKTIKIWEIQRWNCIRTLKGHTNGIESVIVSPNDKWIISGSWDNTIRTWDFFNGICLRTLEKHKDSVMSLKASHDGKTLISGANDNSIVIWDLEKGTFKNIYYGHTGPIMSVSVNPDNTSIISGSWDRTIKIWDIRSTHLSRSIRCHSQSVMSVAISYDNTIGVSGSWDNSIKIWDFKKGEYLYTLSGHSGPVMSVAFAADNKYLVSGSLDGTIRIWDLENKTCKRILHGHTEGVFSVAICSNRNILVSGSWDCTIRVWDLVNGRCKGVLPGYNSPIYAVKITPDGNTIISGSGDKTIRIWDIAKKECIHEFLGHNGLILSIAISNDQKILVSGSNDKTIRVWDFEEKRCIRVLKGLSLIHI